MASMENATGTAPVGGTDWTSSWLNFAGNVLSSGLEYQKAKLSVDMQTQALPYTAAARAVNGPAAGGGVSVAIGGGTLLLIGLAAIFLLTARD